MLHVTLEQLQRWRSVGLRLPLSVDVLTTNLEESDSRAQVQSLLLDYYVPPALLELEITESMVMDGQSLTRLGGTRCLQEAQQQRSTLTHSQDPF